MRLKNSFTVFVFLSALSMPAMGKPPDLSPKPVTITLECLLTLDQIGDGDPHAYDSATVSIDTERYFSLPKTNGTLVSIPQIIRRFSQWANARGMRLQENPGLPPTVLIANSKTTNRALDKMDPHRQKIPIRFVDWVAQEQFIPPREYRLGIAKGEIPLATSGEFLVHDYFGHHRTGALLMPKPQFDRLSARANFLNEVEQLVNNPDWLGNSGLDPTPTLKEINSILKLGEFDTQLSSDWDSVTETLGASLSFFTSEKLKGNEIRNFSNAIQADASLYSANPTLGNNTQMMAREMIRRLKTLDFRDSYPNAIKRSLIARIEILGKRYYRESLSNSEATELARQTLEELQESPSN